MAGRPRSVISPPLPPRATKPKAEPATREWNPKPGTAYRVRITDEQPFGGFATAHYSDDLFELELEHAGNLEAGLGSIIEEAMRGGYHPLPVAPPVFVRDLAQRGLARETTATVRKPDGTTREETRWQIAPQGYEEIRAAMGLPARS